MDTISGHLDSHPTTSNHDWEQAPSILDVTKWSQELEQVYNFKYPTTMLSV